MWPISPSSTCESGYTEADGQLEAATLLENSSRSAAAAPPTLAFSTRREPAPPPTTIADAKSPPSPRLATATTPKMSKRLAHIKVERCTTSPLAADDSGQFSMTTSTIELTPERRTTA